MVTVALGRASANAVTRPQPTPAGIRAAGRVSAGTTTRSSKCGQDDIGVILLAASIDYLSRIRPFLLAYRPLKRLRAKLP